MTLRDVLTCFKAVTIHYTHNVQIKGIWKLCK